jgi:hypothetical protein
MRRLLFESRQKYGLGHIFRNNIIHRPAQAEIGFLTGLGRSLGRLYNKDAG